jgi:hypothetical protein
VGAWRIELANGGELPMNAVTSLLAWLCDGYWPPADTDEELVVQIQDPRRQYTPLRRLAAGDGTDVYLATIMDAAQVAPGAHYLLKVARVREANDHLETERRALAKLAGAAGNTTYRHYFPELVDSFPTADRPARRINVFRFAPAFHTLEEVNAQHPALDGRHLAWIFKRLLTALGFAHRQHLIHGAVLPCHALIHAQSHGLQLVGWGQSITAGQRIRCVSSRYRDWYPAEVHERCEAGPATDLFLAARCIVYLAGGDPRTNWMPDTVPPAMRRFLSTCLLESARMRPTEAWAVLDDFDQLLHTLYGPPKFHELILT